MIELYCQYEHHENEQIIGVCINQICSNKRLCCLGCVKEFHSTHNYDIQGFRQLKNDITTCDGQLQQLTQKVGEIFQILNKLKEMEEILQSSKDFLSKITKQDLQNLGNKDFDGCVNQLLIIKQIQQAFVKFQDFSYDEFNQKLKEIKTKIELFRQSQDFLISNKNNNKTQNELPQFLNRQLSQSVLLLPNCNNELLDKRFSMNSESNLELLKSQMIIQRRSAILPNKNIDNQQNQCIEWNIQSPLQEKIFQFIKCEFIQPQQSDSTGNNYIVQKYNCSIPEEYTNYKIGYFHLIKKEEYRSDKNFTKEEANQQLLLDLAYFQNKVEAYFQQLRINLNLYPENMKMLCLLVLFIEKSQKQISDIFLCKDYQSLYKKIDGLKLCSNQSKHVCEKKSFIKAICQFFKVQYHCSNGKPRK